MSSCSRPDRCATCAETCVYRAPASQDVMSTSWVARSFTTPTSEILAGNGPCREVVIWKIVPSWPSRMRRRTSTTAGLHRSTYPTAPTRPAWRKASATRRPASSVCAMGFSTMVWTPAAASARATSSWWIVGTATIAASIPAPISACTSGSTSRSPATPKRSPAGSARATRSTPEVSRITRA